MISSGGHGWRIGTLSGIPVFLGRSWILVALVMVFIFGPIVNNIMPDFRVGAYAIATLFAVLLLLSVLVHEAAHAIVAQRVGFTVSRIVADFWGGHTAHDGAGGTPGRSAAVAVVGPLANGVLALLGWWATGWFEPGVAWLLAYAFTFANAFVAIFNLLPALPLDGGFLLEALVWRVSGNRYLGTMVAGWFGRLLVVLLGIWAISPMLIDGEDVSLLRIVWVILIGAFLWQGASQAVDAGRLGVRLSRRQVGEVARPVGVIPADAALDGVDWRSRELWIVLGADGRPEGVVDPRALSSVPHQAWSGTTANALAVRLPEGWAATLDESTRLDRVLEIMRSTGSGVVGLLDDSGRPWGAVLVDDVSASGGIGPRS
ncbi:site-2 protease family protein [Ornithinimicrobium sp. Y1847]|uniref:site-2 protease family protein n=1 Tax=Ornithinimicrobium sp. Y1847 TaxID=3405419 RepID=UPI003B67BB33